MTLLDIPGFEAEAAADGLQTGQWRLARVELINWGTFDGHYRIDVARQGHLFTGASGSGKSSLLDAIATVLTPGRWLRFNAAAQEAASSRDDRSLVSYVRGAWSKEADEHLDRAVSTYLRNGPAWSGILLRFENERDAPVTLARLFHIRGGSVDKADLKDLAFIDRGEIGLRDFEPHVSTGIEARRVKAAWPSATITTNGTHKPYFAKLTRLLGISGENALHLLHKTQSAKNLGSLDQLFRNFMLDLPPTFDRARNAVEQFGELGEAHRLVAEAREQLEHLRSLDPAIDAYEDGVAAAAETTRLSNLIEPFQNRITLKLAEDDRAETITRHARAEAEARRAAATLAVARDDYEAARRSASDLGGADAEIARERLDTARKEAAAASDRWQKFADDLATVAVTAPTTAAEFAELRETARQAADAGAGDTPTAADHDDSQSFFSAKKQLADIDAELTELRQRKSNLPLALLRIRRMLAEELGVAESALPFAGELIEVEPRYADWTGAIERVLYPLASALLVREEHLAEVRRLVEGRNLGTRLVFEAVPRLTGTPRAARSDRSLLHRVRVSDGTFHDWLGWRLGEEFDVDCVDHPDDFDDATRAVTIGGQVKKSAGRYEKNDRYPIDDRRQWILGADNSAKIETLLERRKLAEQQQAEAGARLEHAQRQRDTETRRHSVFSRVLRQDWAELDRAAAAALVRQRDEQLQRLTTGNRDLQDALARETADRIAWEGAQVAERAAALDHGKLTELLTELDAEITDLSGRTQVDDLTEADAAALESRYRAVRRGLDRKTIGDVGRQVAGALTTETMRAKDQLAKARSVFEHGAFTFRSRWATASADLTATIEDRAGFRALRDTIEARGLPDYEQRFLRLLREKSRELIGHLLSDIRDAPKHVKDRIDPVNVSLARSRFDRDRVLKIRVKEQRSPEVTQFMADLRSIVDGAWGDDGLVAAERRFATLAEIMRKLGSSESANVAWKQRCLDTREHVTFQAQELDPAGTVTNVHDSSAGLSGGQRQKLVIFCLAAALRYQLAPDDEGTPAFATIILDEAFDKADSSYTRMAMDVFVTFGFHMILATPQKLLTTIEPYVGAVTSISNETRKKSIIANAVFRTVAPESAGAGTVGSGSDDSGSGGAGSDSAELDGTGSAGAGA